MLRYVFRFLDNKAQQEIDSCKTVSLWCSGFFWQGRYSVVFTSTDWGKVFATIISLIGISTKRNNSASFVEEIHYAKKKVNFLFITFQK